MSTIIKEYKLGPGGAVGRGGVIYRPGDSIWLTDDEYEASNKARLTLVNAEGKVVRDAAAVAENGATSSTAPVAPSVTNTVTPRAIAAVEPPPTPPDLSRAVETAQAKVAALTAVRDWDAFVANTTAESLITYIQDSTADEIKAIRDAEKGRGKQKRVKVVSAANAALRRLNMAKARATRDKNLARKRALEAELASAAAVAE